MTGLTYKQLADKDIQTWQTWRQSPTDENFSKLVRRFEAMINKEVSKWRGGTLPMSMLRAEGFKIVGEGVKNYDPAMKVKLSTYLTTQLQKLKRYGYKNQNVLYIPESRILRIRNYKNAKAHLSEVLDRSPSSQEIAEHIGASVAEVKRLESELRSDLIAEHKFDAGQQSNIEAKDFKLGYVYNDLNPKQQVVFERTLGLNGKPVQNADHIAKKLKVTPREVYKIREEIAKQIRRLQHG